MRACSGKLWNRNCRGKVYFLLVSVFLITIQSADASVSASPNRMVYPSLRVYNYFLPSPFFRVELKISQKVVDGDGDVSIDSLQVVVNGEELEVKHSILETLDDVGRPELTYSYTSVESGGQLSEFRILLTYGAQYRVVADGYCREGEESCFDFVDQYLLINVDSERRVTGVICNPETLEEWANCRNTELLDISKPEGDGDTIILD